MLDLEPNTRASSISSFMRWISDRLDEEIEAIERSEEEFGVEKIYTEELEKKPNNLTDDQKIKLVKDVNNLYNS